MSPPDLLVAAGARAIPRAAPIRLPAPALAVPALAAGFVRRLGWVAIPFAIYLAGGLVFSLGAGIVTGDAWSRVGNAYYVLYSRDPHLAAIGFVWNPLPSLLELPLLPFKAIWPAIVDRGVAANLMSAAFMALAVRELWLWLREIGTPRPAAIGLLVAFAAHPMILLYGGNGMSEAPFLFFLLAAGRALGAWLSRADVGRLAAAGLALALAYLTRYEAIGAMAGVIGAVAIVSFHRSRGPGTASARERAVAAAADAAIVAAPAVAAFALWALASWLIVGSPFETFSSVYGNASQVGLSEEQIRASTGASSGEMIRYLAGQVSGLEPALPALLAGSLALAALRRDVRLVAPIAVFGTVLGVSAVTFLAGGSFGWLRFSIVAIPLAVVAGGIALARLGRSRRTPWRVVTRTLATAAVTGLLLAALPAAVTTLFDARLAREEAPKLGGLIAPGAVVPGERRATDVGGEVARYLDAMDLPRGSVVVDVALGFWVVLQSEDPEQFVITPDRDFERILNDPATFDARYLLVPPAAGLGSFDALGRAHPGLYRDGAGIATLVAEFGDPSGAGAQWRLYEVIGAGAGSAGRSEAP